MVRTEAEQVRAVRRAYAQTQSVNNEFEREFTALSQMRHTAMADQYRKSRGLSPRAKTPYDPT